MNMIIWAVWLVGALGGTAIYLLLIRLFPGRFLSRNYRSMLVPSSAGIVIVAACDITFVSLSLFTKLPSEPSFILTVCVVTAFGSLGLADDLYGDRTVGGFRGHIMTLIQRRELTTGAAKAVGGGLAALAVGAFLHRSDIFGALLGASIIALSANAVNLTDTRPGRCLAASFVLTLVAMAIGMHAVTAVVASVYVPVVVIAAVLFLYDRSAKLMIGDTGSNALGALVGLLWATISPRAAQIIYLLLLIWFHWWTESHSLSKTIEKNGWMRQIDRVIGLRG